MVPFHAYGSDQIEEREAPATGPTVRMRVVGVVRNLSQFVFVTDGQAIVSPGFVARYRDEAVILENASVQLRDGVAGMAAAPARCEPRHRARARPCSTSTTWRGG